MEEILNSISNNLYELFEKKYLKNILKAEDMNFACIDKKNKTIKEFITKEIGDNDEAVAFFNEKDLDDKCPPNKYYRIAYHTHGILLKDQTEEDNLTMKDMLKDGNADAFCSLGNDGILCKNSKSYNMKWNNIINNISKLENAQKFPASTKKIEEFDQIYCFITQSKNGIITKCVGKNNDDVFKNIGEFQDVSASNVKIFNSTQDNYIQQIIVKPDTNKKIKCAILEKDARFLICNTE